MATTTRGFRYPILSNDPDVPRDIKNLADDADAMFVQGVFGSRPTFGKIGREYYATDTGRTYLDTGAAWVLKGSNDLAENHTPSFVGGISIAAVAGSVPAIRTNQIVTEWIIRNKKLTSDAKDTFGIGGDGHMFWGPGGSTDQDTGMYRENAGVIRFDAALNIGGGNIAFANSGAVVQRNASADNTTVFATRAASRSVDAFSFDALGTHFWGPGSSTPDTSLARGAAGLLVTNGSFQAGNGVFSYGISGNSAFLAKITGDSGYRMTVLHNGNIYWGDGTNAGDVILSRSGTSVLSLTGALASNSNLTAAGAVSGATLRMVPTVSEYASGGFANPYLVADFVSSGSSPNKQMDYASISAGDNVRYRPIVMNPAGGTGSPIRIGRTTDSGFSAKLDVAGNIVTDSGLFANTVSANGNLSAGGIISGAGGIDWAGNQAVNPQPTSNLAGSLRTNLSGGSGEMTLWNNYYPASESFAFFQATGTNTRTKVLSISPTGDLSCSQIYATGVAANGAFFANRTGDNNYRCVILHDGSIVWGPGNSNGDVILSRTAAAEATLTGNFKVTGNIGFFNTVPATKRTGYGSGAMIGSGPVQLTAASTLSNVITTLSALVADLRAYGLIGA